MIGTGSRLGPYEITGKLGEGGMGEVWRATDSRLKREVAVKVLPAAFTADPERLARFEREAQLLAQLQHPNIAAVYGLEEQDGVRALVMELVEGEDLSAVIARGALPVHDALAIARQVAEALEAAHERGIVHRDLKPGNVKVRADCAVKVLDFGLAKAMDATAASAPSAAELARSPTLMHSPTLTAVHGTQLGVLLGTAAYMAPEQARGGAVDRRADIWAFGVVLHEMLTGRQLFPGETVSDTLAAVLRADIGVDALPRETPAAVRTLLRRCLERNPRNRLHDAADARLVLEDVLAGRVEETAAASVAAPTGGRWARALPWLVVAALAVGLLAALRLRPASSGAVVRAVEISVPSGHLLEKDAPPVLSPDGILLVFGASDPRSGSQLWLRPLDRFESTPLEGTDGASHPFWSPDSQSIGFFRLTDLTLRRYDLATRSTQLIARTGALGRGGSWGTDGTILFSPGANDPIQRVPASGGTPVDVTVLDRSVLDGSHRFPVWLPDGRHFLFTFWSNNQEAAARVGGIYVGSIAKDPIRKLTPDACESVLAGSDRLLVYRDGRLVAVPFDPAGPSANGFGEQLADHPLYSLASGALAASASKDGDVAFALASGEGTGELTWLDRRGGPTASLGVERISIAEMVAAPDGKRFAGSSVEPTGSTIVVVDSERQLLTRVTRGTVDFHLPAWSPDGASLAFNNQSAGTNSIYVQPADGSRPPELVLTDPQRDFEASQWPRADLLLLTSSAKASYRGEIWQLDLASRRARVLLADRSANVGDAALSPDGRWLAYRSDESGNPEIFLRPFPALDRKWQVSQGGGEVPHWRSDGRELLWVSTADRGIHAIAIDAAAASPVLGAATRLFAPRSPLLAFAPVPDHSRFLVSLVPPDMRSEPIHVILGWRAAQKGSAPR